MDADRELGPEVAAELRRRLADLDAAPSVADLPPLGNLRVNGRGEEAELITTLTNGWSMAFTACHMKNPLTADGEIAWPNVSRIKILRIEKTNA
jgi:hypothetical protein